MSAARGRAGRVNAGEREPVRRVERGYSPGSGSVPDRRTVRHPGFSRRPSRTAIPRTIWPTMDDDDPSAARDAAEVLLCTAFLLAVPTLPERQLAWIRQMAAVQRPATREYIDRNWPKPVREALLGPDRPTT